MVACSIEGCNRPNLARRMCGMHYQRWAAHGDVNHTRQWPSLESRFWPKVNKSEPSVCWEWLATRNNKGYGVIGDQGGHKLAHRVAYELVVGPVPEGLSLDHLCGHPWCVNPHHLEPVTHRENVLRGRATSAVNARKTHCIRGHEFTPENTYRNPTSGHRQCKTCRREFWRLRSRADSRNP